MSVLGVVLAGVTFASWTQRRAADAALTVVIDEANRRINLNSADADDLDDLPGVGPVLARRILEYRDRHGGFTRLEELKEVKGIGDRTYRRIAPYVTL